MVESLVALIFLGVTAGSILSAVAYCDNQANTARRREAILEVLRGQIDQVRANATGGTVTNGVTASSVSVSGIQNKVSVTVTISNVAGFASLKQVDVTASWIEAFRGGTRSDSMSFSTWVKPNET